MKLTRRAVLVGLTAMAAPALAVPPRRNVLIIPGNDLCADFYSPLVRQLASKGFAARAVTLPGYDGTPALQPTTPRGLIEWVATQARGLGPNGILVGHSLGGLLAFLAAAEPGVQLGGLALLEPAIVAWPKLAKRLARRYQKKSVDADRSDLIEAKGPFYQRIADVHSFPQPMMDVAVRCRANSDPDVARALVTGYRDFYPLPFDKVTVPTLLLRGEASGWVMKKGQKSLDKRLPNSRTGVIANAAHWLANENDADVAAAIATL